MPDTDDDDGSRDPGSRPRGVFEADEEAPLAELETAWADGGYHGFCVLEHSLWSAISISGEVLTGNTPDGRTSRSGRTGRHCGERIGGPGDVPGNPSARGTSPQPGRDRCLPARVSLRAPPQKPEQEHLLFPLPGVCQRGGPDT